MVGQFYLLLIMAFAVSLDAFSASISLGLLNPSLRKILKMSLTVGVFHIFMPLIGIITGQFFSEQLGNYGLYVGGLILIIVGFQIIFTSLFSKEDVKSTSKLNLILFSLIVSFDSLAIGLSLGFYRINVIVAVLIFGIVAIIMTLTGLLLGKKMSNFRSSYSGFFSGLILIIIGLKLLLT